VLLVVILLLPAIDTIQQHRQLARSQLNRARTRRNVRKLEHARFQALVPQHVAIAVPCQDLQSVAATRSEDEKMTAQRIFADHRLHALRQTITRRTACRSLPKPARSAAPAHRPTTGDSAGRSRLHLQNRQQPTQVTRIKPRLNHQAPAMAMP
jgi:hypothetical protein